MAEEKPIFTCSACHKEYKREASFIKHKCKPKPVPAKELMECKYCHKKFKQEASFISHKCEPRLRVEELKTNYGRIAFVAYQQFYRSVGMRSRSRDKTPIEFVNSTYYHGFMKFGKFIEGNAVTRYQDYIKYLIQYNVKLESWSSDAVHSIYIRGMVKKEPMESAVEKSFSTMTKWAENNGEPWTDYFRRESTSRIIHNIKMGRISPWVVYNSQSGEEFIQRLSRKEMDEVYDYIDPSYWGVKFQRNSGLANAARSTLQSVGL